MIDSPLFKQELLDQSFGLECHNLNPTFGSVVIDQETAQPLFQH